MLFHTNQPLFAEAITATAQHFNIQEIYVEKDYWITVALYKIFHAPIGQEVVFKGGTALSKAHHLVERFSEDIDLVVFRNQNDSNNQLKNKLKAISDVIEEALPNIEVEGVTNKKGMIRKTAHKYLKAGVKGSFGQIRDFIVLESSWLGNTEPYVIKTIDCYITQMMQAKGQQQLIERYNMLPFKVQALSAERSICEKIMSLVRFSQSENPIEDLRNKIRHIYDLHMMLKKPELSAFLHSPDFDNLLLWVGNDDIYSFKNNNGWLTNHPKDVILFTNRQKTWNRLKATYEGPFKDLVLGELPDEMQLAETLKIIGDRLQSIVWTVNPKKVA